MQYSGCGLEGGKLAPCDGAAARVWAVIDAAVERDGMERV
jgi:hypothetical protein